jgi:hypothetical protein
MRKLVPPLVVTAALLVGCSRGPDTAPFLGQFVVAPCVLNMDKVFEHNYYKTGKPRDVAAQSLYQLQISEDPTSAAEVKLKARTTFRPATTARDGEFVLTEGSMDAQGIAFNQAGDLAISLRRPGSSGFMSLDYTTDVQIVLRPHATKPHTLQVVSATVEARHPENNELRASGDLAKVMLMDRGRFILGTVMRWGLTEEQGREIANPDDSDRSVCAVPVI